MRGCVMLQDVKMKKEKESGRAKTLVWCVIWWIAFDFISLGFLKRPWMVISFSLTLRLYRCYTRRKTFSIVLKLIVKFKYFPTFQVIRLKLPLGPVHWIIDCAWLFECCANWVAWHDCSLSDVIQREWKENQVNFDSCSWSPHGVGNF